MENILRKGVNILQSCTSEKIKICRVSENIFYFWFMELFIIIPWAKRILMS